MKVFLFSTLLLFVYALNAQTNDKNANYYDLSEKDPKMPNVDLRSPDSKPIDFNLGNEPIKFGQQSDDLKSKMGSSTFTISPVENRTGFDRPFSTAPPNIQNNAGNKNEKGSFNLVLVISLLIVISFVIYFIFNNTITKHILETKKVKPVITTDLIRNLNDLNELKEKGALTEDEFTELKKRILNSDS
jgi:hypothetical protein